MQSEKTPKTVQRHENHQKPEKQVYLPLFPENLYPALNKVFILFNHVYVSKGVLPLIAFSNLSLSDDWNDNAFCLSNS